MSKPITLLVASTLLTTLSIGQLQTGEVKISGAMKNVMWQGQLDGTIALDSLADIPHLYGIGPVAYLRGELLIIDGKAYKSTVVNDSVMQVEETFQVKAPFFGYASISSWTSQKLPVRVQTIAALQTYLDKITRNAKRPFMFKLSGIVKSATIHVVNLPEGATVRSPEEAHVGQVNYTLCEEPVEIVGLFSTQHQGILTHHSTFLHMHLITADRTKMGHLDDLIFKKGTVTLFLPAG